MRKVHALRTTLLALSLLAAAGPTAIADNGGPDVEHEHSHPYGSAIAEAKISAFAEAARTVEEISARYVPKIRAAREAGDKARVRTQAGKAREEITQAIRRQPGISVREYRTIAQRAQQDANLAAKIRARMGRSSDPGVGQ